MDTILFPLMWVIGWIIVGVHKVLTFLGMSSGSGPAWVLAIVGMTIIVRALMIPLFNKQIRSQRAMQRLSPEIQKIQKKYKGKKDQISQQRQQEELMALYKSHGSSPFASCLPMFIQMPIFFALYRVLWNIGALSDGTYARPSLGGIDKARATELAGSTVFGAPLTSSIGNAGSYGPLKVQIIIVAVVLIVLMIVTLFITQKQVMTKNMPVNDDPNNPAAKMTKYMLYGMPLIYVFTGYAFQVGVLVYWLASNIWNMGQQTWLITTNPSPGSPAYKARQERLRAKRIAKGLPPEEEDTAEEARTTGQRVQPMSAKRQKKKGKNYDPLANGPADLVGSENNGAQSGTEKSADSDEATEAQEAVGKDGLTDAQRAQKRYERRLAERQRSREKAQQRAKRQQQNKKKRNF
ncbi:MAG: membrane protein insertase YidC [Arcanobacterium sp.]|nr:membrane protein insertase YidC [Arcanobacterium sp.]MDY5589857.1 membrane protein insertase YidC [Arcanobacterium sp.]